jgi:hypothetical protein
MEAYGALNPDLDLSYHEALPATRSIRVRPISSDEHDFRYEVEIVLAPGLIKLRRGEVFFFRRDAIERDAAVRT